MKIFYQVAANALLTTLGNFFLWFAVVFWVYLETRSVLASSIIGGTYMVMATLSGFWFGGIVDHHKKKNVMLFASLCTLFCFVIAGILYAWTPPEAFQQPDSSRLWIFVLAVLLGVVMSNLRTIALPITVTILVPEGRRDRANGVNGMIMGLSSSGAGIARAWRWLISACCPSS